MIIPDFQSIMLPLLKLAGDGKEHYIHSAVKKLSDHFDLSEKDRTKLLPSGQQPIFYNRVGWARTYLKKAGLLEDPRRGYFRITDRGLKTLGKNLQKIDMKYLRKFPEYVKFRRTKKKPKHKVATFTGEDDLTPEEAIEEAYQKIRDDRTDQLLENVLKSSPGFFEKLVVELLVAMGYGGSRREAARAVGQSGDEGIDGIIDEDRLGLDTIYLQAKRWNKNSPVGRPEIQKFVGALQGQRAKKGVFITTSKFTDEAKKYASSIETKVVLIDGDRLSELMFDNSIGVSFSTSYEIKNIDSDYFGEISGEE